MAKKLPKKSNNPAGRPPKKESERQSERLAVRCTAAQKQRIESNAKEAGMSVSAWLVRQGCYAGS